MYWAVICVIALCAGFIGALQHYNDNKGEERRL